ncbi:hypothetical protein PFISCL1PPCAC_22833, partial [Pristionchus fissidentatus]
SGFLLDFPVFFKFSLNIHVKMLEQRCCLAGLFIIGLYAALNLAGALSGEHERCHRPTCFYLLDSLLATITIFIISPLLITIFVARRYSCLLPLSRFLLYFYAMVSIFRLGSLAGTTEASFGSCPTVCILSVLSIVISISLVGGVTFVVEELQEERRMLHYWTDETVE